MRHFFPILLIVVLFASALSGQASSPTPPAPSPTPAAAALPVFPGRFQIIAVVPSNGVSEVWMVDSQTADTWRRSNGRWLYAGNPTVDPGAKFPATRPAATVPARILPEAPAR